MFKLSYFSVIPNSLYTHTQTHTQIDISNNNYKRKQRKGSSEFPEKSGSVSAEIKWPEEV